VKSEKQEVKSEKRKIIKTSEVILNFDLSSIAGGTVNSGTMVLVNKNGINTVAAQVTRCTSPSDWVENQVTWNKYSTAGGSWTTAGGDIDNTKPVTIAFTHSGTAGGTTTIGSMHTYGTDALANRGNIVSLILRLVDEAPGSGNKGGDIWTINGTGAFVPPKLVLNYHPPPIGTSTFLPRMNLLGIG